MPEVNREPGIHLALVTFLGLGLMVAMHYLLHV
jgi:hypothetical protein